MADEPLLNGRKPTRAQNGRFLPGCPAGPGNPLARKANQLRVALSRATTVADVREIAKRMIALAKGGDIQAAKLVFERALGPAEAIDVLAQLAELREIVDELLTERNAK